MTALGEATGLARDVLAGKTLAIARMITQVERGPAGGAPDFAEVYRAGGRAQIIGVTGPAGAGKSTLVAVLAAELRRRGLTIGVLAVDPSSPYSGGSVLGDRIRMQALWGDPGVFIRSMATRNALGGLARATGDAVAVLDAAGKDVVIIETVGVGQDEVEIARVAHSVVVVSAPGLGDEIQAMKAGLLEIADVHVVNKSDREGADRTIAELRSVQALTAAAGWQAPVLATCAESGDGVPALADALDAHRRWLLESGEIEDRGRAIAAYRLKTMLTALVEQRLDEPAPGSALAATVDALHRRTTDPWNAARALLAEDAADRTKGTP
jgi:LAO/AO transport system kinase